MADHKVNQTKDEKIKYEGQTPKHQYWESNWYKMVESYLSKQVKLIQDKNNCLMR